MLSPARIFGLVTYLPRLFGLAVACRDWKQAESLLRRTVQSLQPNVKEPSLSKLLSSGGGFVALDDEGREIGPSMRAIAQELHGKTVSAEQLKRANPKLFETLRLKYGLGDGDVAEIPAEMLSPIELMHLAEEGLIELPEGAAMTLQ